MKKEDRFAEAFIFLMKYGWLGFVGSVNVYSHIFQAPNELMLTRGVVCVVGFLILLEVHLKAMQKER